MSKMGRKLMNINFDDDEDVENFKHKQELAAGKKDAEAEKKRTAGMGDNALLNEVVAKVTRIIANAENGDGVGINTLHMFIGSPNELGKKDAVSIIACRNSSSNDKPADSAIRTRSANDFKIFSDLVSDGNDVTYPISLLSSVIFSLSYT